jgi:predicted branched-subunit amino acid permease
MTAPASADAPYWSFAGFCHGLRLGLPVTPGIVVFGLIVGAVAERQGLSFVQNLAMSVFVYSGVAQLVALEAWPGVLTWGAIAALALLAAVVGARMFLMSVSMRPWLGPLPKWQAYASLYLLTDASWLIAMRYRGEGGRDVAVFAGASVLMIAGWLVAVSAGYYVGGLIADPKVYGFDLVLPVFFAAMLVPLWGGARRATGWAVAGVVAVAVERLLPGWWFIVAGSVAGALVGGYLDEAKAETGQ